MGADAPGPLTAPPPPREQIKERYPKTSSWHMMCHVNMWCSLYFFFYAFLFSGAAASHLRRRLRPSAPLSLSLSPSRPRRGAPHASCAAAEKPGPAGCPTRASLRCPH